MEREQLKIAIYARVSMKKSQDPEMLLAELREYIRNRKWKITGEYAAKVFLEREIIDRNSTGRC